jgi:hypothetical protein
VAIQVVTALLSYSLPRSILVQLSLKGTIWGPTACPIPRRLTRIPKTARQPPAPGHAAPGADRPLCRGPLTTLDTDVPNARAILMRTLRPFKLTSNGTRYRDRLDTHGIHNRYHLSVMVPVFEDCNPSTHRPTLNGVRDRKLVDFGYGARR